jgi:hypothetical protein
MAEETNTQESASLSLTDLKLCLQLIDICSQRGAFKPAEYMAVGALHSKLTAFLAQIPTAEPTAEPTEETKDD